MAYLKSDQTGRQRKIYRNHEEIWEFLHLRKPTSQEESEAMRYGKCACPLCPARGTVDRPLDLHHIVPRSQSKELANNFLNHLYVCGDFFPGNHHKALHGEMTQGRKDWLALGVFSAFPPDMIPRVSEAEALIDLAVRDTIARALLLTQENITSFLDYARKQGVMEDGVMLTDEDSGLIDQWKKKTLLNNG